MSTNEEESTHSALHTLDLLAHRVDVVAFDALAVRTSVRLAQRATAADLARPTPCAAWSLHDLLDHMTELNRTFAAASIGNGDPELGRLHSRTHDPVATFQKSAEHLLDAFAVDGILSRKFTLLDFGTDVPFSAGQAIGFHFVDSIVHSWDIAKTLGIPVDHDHDILEAALTIAQSVPGGEARTIPGAAFGPEVEWPIELSLDKIVAVLGRSPASS
jgi:uncharacterized protein (TIGR03086 family)